MLHFEEPLYKNHYYYNTQQFNKTNIGAKFLVLPLKPKKIFITSHVIKFVQSPCK